MRAAAGLPSESDMGELESALRRGGADITALTYVRTLKRNNLIGSQKGAHPGLRPHLCSSPLHIRLGEGTGAPRRTPNAQGWCCPPHGTPSSWPG